MAYNNAALAISPANVPAVRPQIYSLPRNPAIIAVERLTSAELCQRYIDYIDRKETTVKGYMTCIRRFSKWLAENSITLQAATREDMKAYRDYLSNSELKAGTRTQYFRAAKALVHWAYCEGLILEDIGDNLHGAKIRHDVHKKDALQREDVAQIAATIDRSDETGKRLYAMYLLCVICGLRTIEIHRADVGDLKTVGGTTYLYLQGKGHDDKDAPVLLIKEVYNAVQDYLQHRSEKVTAKSPLFTSTSNRSKGGRIATTTISTMLKTLLVNAGYDSDRLTAHSLRHTSGTGAHKAGIDLYGVQHLMRHCDPATSEIYIHDDDHKAAEEKGRKGIYDYYFNGAELNPVMPELEAEIMTLTLEQQQALLAQIRAQKGGNNE